MDETALFYELMPSKTLCTQAKKFGTKQSKNRVTLVLCCNSDGTHKFPLTMIGHSKYPRCFKQFNHSAYLDYFHNKKAWMTAKMFNTWIENFDKEMRLLNKQAALILDNAPSHVCSTKITNTKLVFLPPNLTSIIQPLDAGIISCLKRKYKSKLVSSCIECLESNKSFKISLKMCVEMVTAAWQNISESTIKNCFLHCKISDSQPVEIVEDNDEAKKFDEKVNKLGLMANEDFFQQMSTFILKMKF